MTGQRLLVVDDEMPIRRALERALVAHGFDVTTANGGADALDQIAFRPPDLIVLDLMMPEVNGFAVLSDLRKWSDLPVIVLSAKGDERAKVDALDLGADDYLVKPFGIDELLARVRAVLRRTGISESGPINAGNVVIDLARHVVAKSGHEVHLTPTEYDLLRVLATHPDKVLTHRYLLEQAWGGYAASNTQQLRVYINYLRHKLENDAAHPSLIITEPGIGYRLVTMPADSGP